MGACSGSICWMRGNNTCIYVAMGNRGRKKKNDIHVIFLREKVVIIRVHPLHMVLEFVQWYGLHCPRVWTDSTGILDHRYHQFHISWYSCYFSFKQVFIGTVSVNKYTSLLISFTRYGCVCVCVSVCVCGILPKIEAH